MILILYTRIDSSHTFEYYSRYYANFPPILRAKIDAYRSGADKVAGILGRQLLSDGLNKLGIQGPHLHAIQYKTNRRPYFPHLPYVDFNISHSGSFVVCALSRGARLGIDIEKKKSVNLANFTSQFSMPQWEELENAQDAQELFHKYISYK